MRRAIPGLLASCNILPASGTWTEAVLIFQASTLESWESFLPVWPKENVHQSTGLVAVRLEPLTIHRGNHCQARTPRPLSSTCSQPQFSYEMGVLYAACPKPTALAPLPVYLLSSDSHSQLRLQAYLRRWKLREGIWTFLVRGP